MYKSLIRYAILLFAAATQILGSVFGSYITLSAGQTGFEDWVVGEQSGYSAKFLTEDYNYENFGANQGPTSGQPHNGNAVWSLPMGFMPLWADSYWWQSTLQWNGLTPSLNAVLASGNLLSERVVIHSVTVNEDLYMDGIVRLAGFSSLAENAWQSESEFPIVEMGSDRSEAGRLGIIGSGLIAVSLLKPWQRMDNRR